ncbi:hypothetical protein [Anaplasma phagocytophilum]|uniref:hypothetical protein n=1 Tax=Anaplasma phagocytophilum TaxID=948 RepID=UPI002010A180|nr:hypothetical protein [Anaplasma phagocytophilum]UQD54617.1 hypothetical protein ESP60_04910 [Anaplasma phagocytophilum]
MKDRDLGPAASAVSIKHHKQWLPTQVLWSNKQYCLIQDFAPIPICIERFAVFEEEFELFVGGYWLLFRKVALCF